ncbi:dienelactone hydrolase family protein [Occultella glacieicola]|uniref:Dienelactone hydrolase family protein n=1 Tax=Occultella glacieicola TaxID=2518684 RepID=A0ABY2EAH7_9MICO|nr:dienelactone hydrolase family protein [Occultella glacieicola]TDE98961.1 dienelactone hydrolase family protein [Occultella glacieicola]
MTDPTHDVLTLTTDSGDLPVHRWRPPSGTGPGLLLLQEIFGVSEYIRGRAADLARAGYVVYAPQLYWRLADGELDEAAPDVLERGMALAGRLPWADALGDARVTLAALRAAPEVSGGVGVVGFCYGGGLAFNVAALEPVDALVSYYGSALPALLALAPAITAPSLHHFGTEDAYIPLESVETIRAAVTADNGSAEFRLHEGAGHAFDNPNPMFHHARAAAAAWPVTLAFLGDHLGGSQG